MIMLMNVENVHDWRSAKGGNLSWIKTVIGKSDSLIVYQREARILQNRGQEPRKIRVSKERSDTRNDNL